MKLQKLYGDDIMVLPDVCSKVGGLLNDPEITVRITAVETLVHLYQIFGHNMIEELEEDVKINSSQLKALTDAIHVRQREYNGSDSGHLIHDDNMMSGKNENNSNSSNNNSSSSSYNKNDSGSSSSSSSGNNSGRSSREEKKSGPPPPSGQRVSMGTKRLSMSGTVLYCTVVQLYMCVVCAHCTCALCN